MKKIYKRIKVNKGLLKLNAAGNSGTDYDQFIQNEISATIPTGKVAGVYFISYLLNRGRYSGNVMRAMPFAISHTNITIKDSRGRPLTEPTDIKDYEHKAGGYNKGFKTLDFDSQNERITIAWESIASPPICGEFIFEIEAPEKC